MGCFFKTNQEQKEYISRIARKYFSDFKTGGFFYRHFLKSKIKNNSVIMDAGCGEKGILAEFKNIPQLIVGIDKDKESLRKNSFIGKKMIADLENLPLPDSQFEAVACEFVLEHLAHPDKAIKEIYRVLKPGGSFIFITPNLKHLAIFLGKYLPFFARTFFRKKVLKKEETAHKTYYRANTSSLLEKIGRQAGFSSFKIERAGNPEYLGFIKPLVIPSIRLERFIFRRLPSFQTYLIGCFEK